MRLIYRQRLLTNYEIGRDPRRVEVRFDGVDDNAACPRDPLQMHAVPFARRGGNLLSCRLNDLI